MGWFDRVFGGPKGFASTSADERTRVATAFLNDVVARTGIVDAVISPPVDDELILRGALQGLALEVTLRSWGQLTELTLRYDAELGFIDLEFDPELDPDPALAPDDQLVVAPGVFLEGSGAQDELHAFEQLPVALRRRVLADLARLRIRYFRSRTHEHTMTVHDEVPEVADPVTWLASILQLGADVAIARGARGLVPR
jgi:hypothetical protein